MIPVLHEYQLASGVRAFSTTRQGGVSEGAYASFNINAYCGDDPACLEANLASLADAPPGSWRATRLRGGGFLV